MFKYVVIEYNLSNVHGWFNKRMDSLSKELTFIIRWKDMHTIWFNAYIVLFLLPYLLYYKCSLKRSTMCVNNLWNDNGAKLHCDTSIVHEPRYVIGHSETII